MVGNNGLIFFFQLLLSVWVCFNIFLYQPCYQTTRGLRSSQVYQTREVMGYSTLAYDVLENGLNLVILHLAWLHLPKLKNSVCPLGNSWIHVLLQEYKCSNLRLEFEIILLVLLSVSITVMPLLVCVMSTQFHGKFVPKNYGNIIFTKNRRG